jgi:hypothetical protein
MKTFSYWWPFPLAAILIVANFAIHAEVEVRSAVPLPAPVTVRAYTVTSPAAFPALPLPARALVFRNGVFQTPGIDYRAGGLTLVFPTASLRPGDGISVVTIP